MSDKIQTVDVEKIMEEIRQNIKDRGYSEDMLSFSEATSDVEITHGVSADDLSYDETEMNQFIQAARGVHNIPYYEPMQGNKLKVFVKRVIRKLMAFQMQSIRERQNQFNYNVIQSIRELALHTAELEDAICEKEELVEELETRIEALEEQLKQEKSK